MPTNDALKALHADLIDVQNGYTEAIKDTDVAEMKTLFEKMLFVHRKAHKNVHSILASRGESPDETGSFMSVVHKTVISVRSAVTGLDRSSLSSFASGEEHLIAAYDRAIDENRDDVVVADELKLDKNELVSIVDELKRKAA